MWPRLTNLCQINSLWYKFELKWWGTQFSSVLQRWWWIEVSPNGQKDLGLTSGLCRVCMFFPCVCGFSWVVSWVLSHSSKTHIKVIRPSVLPTVWAVDRHQQANKTAVHRKTKHPFLLIQKTTWMLHLIEYLLHGPAWHWSLLSLFKLLDQLGSFKPFLLLRVSWFKRW